MLSISYYTWWVAFLFGHKLGLWTITPIWRDTAFSSNHLMLASSSPPWFYVLLSAWATTELQPHRQEVLVEWLRLVGLQDQVAWMTWSWTCAARWGSWRLGWTDMLKEAIAILSFYMKENDIQMLSHMLGNRYVYHNRVVIDYLTVVHSGPLVDKGTVACVPYSR